MPESTSQMTFRTKRTSPALALGLPAKSVERDPEDVLGLGGIGGWDLADARDHLDDFRDCDVRSHDASVLGALQQRLAGREERLAASSEERRARVHVVEQLVGERPL